jgi:tRNA(Ile)-lysidine synthase
MELLFKHIESSITDFDKNYWVALSGGLDSVVLLHVMMSVRKHFPLKLQAIHIHHGLSAHADDWQTHCENLCREWSIPLFSEKIYLPTKKNIEEAARQKRYEIFKKFLAKDDILLTAHHEDDQAETVLLQLLRGAGPKGLAAMPKQKKLGKGFLLRPFLSFSRATLEMYATTHALQWIQDESNDSKQFSRNFLRHEILLTLKKRWPSVTQTIARVAKQCALQEKILKEKILEDLNHVMDKSTQRLSLKKLLTFSSEVQAQILRAWLQSLNFPLPHDRKMQQILYTFLQASPDRFPLIQFGSIELRRYRDEIFAMHCLPQNVQHRYTWDLRAPLHIPHLGEIRVEEVQGQGFTSSIQTVQIRFRQGGEYCRMPGRDCHHELKKLFQDWRVPPWLRSRIPLIFFEEQLIAVVGYFMDVRFIANPHELGRLPVLISNKTF